MLFVTGEPNRRCIRQSNTLLGHLVTITSSPLELAVVVIDNEEKQTAEVAKDLWCYIAREEQDSFMPMKDWCLVPLFLTLLHGNHLFGIY